MHNFGAVGSCSICRGRFVRNKTQYYLLIVGLFCLGVFYAALSLSSMALYVFIETKMATAIYADTQMQWAFRILCALVAGAIFVLIVTGGTGGIVNMFKKYAALIPLLAFSIGSTMTSNIGMLSENEKLKSNNLEIIKLKESELFGLEVDRALVQDDGNVSHGEAPKIRKEIRMLTNEIATLKSSQHATIKDKYAGVEIDLYFMTIDVSSVFKVIGGSLGLIALLLEFVFAWSCAIIFAKWFALISRGFAHDSQDDSHVDSREIAENSQPEKMSAKDRRQEKAIEKGEAKYHKNESDNKRHKLNALVGLMIDDENITNKVNSRTYSDTEKGFTTRLCEEAFEIVKRRRAGLE